MMQREYYETLQSRINEQLKDLRDKYSISQSDITNFISEIDLQPPIRKKTILQSHEQCGARKQDGHQCSRRHKPNEIYCGKHIKNRPFGVYNGADITTSKSKTISVSVKKRIERKQRNFDDIIVLKSVQVKNKYYYMDKHRILYNPEPVNGCYEVIGKLKNNEEIFYATALR